MKGKLFAVGVLTIGCAAPGGAPPPPDDGPDYRVESPAGRRSRIPTWAGRPLSWDKLRTIGEWLQDDRSRTDKYWVVEGHLQLAEGRLHYARREAAGAAAREAAASAGFHRVLAHPSATTAQRKRAELGVRSLRNATAIPASGRALPGVLPRSSWGARAAVPSRLTPASGSWSWITIHHSAEPDPPRLDGSLATTAAALRDIQSAHVRGEGYGDVGYHFLIDPYGRVLEGRDLRWQGAHSHGSNNVGNVGVCLLGNFEHQRPTPAALEAMHGLVDVLCGRLGVPEHNVRGHDDWRSTACPGRYLKPHLARYR